MVKGTESAILIDTGYGKRNLRAFVEEHITTPYMVINSHGHPDHIGRDALNEGLWLFNYGSLPMKQLYETIRASVKLDLEYYLCGHSDEVYKKEKLYSHIRNIENLKIEEASKQNRLGSEPDACGICKEKTMNFEEPMQNEAILWEIYLHSCGAEGRAPSDRSDLSGRQRG